MSWVRSVIVPLSALVVILSGPACSAEAIEPIQGAFGVQLGADFSPTNDPDTFTLLNGERAYYFTPGEPSSYFDRYLVKITPITRKVHTIIALGLRDDLTVCKREASSLISLLRERHGPSFTWLPLDTLPVDIDYEIIVQADRKRAVGIGCGGDARIILQAIYVDDDLAELAIQENQEVEDDGYVI